MIVLGITGGIGSGKSEVSRLLRLIGIPVYDTDTEAKRLNDADPKIRRRLVALFGNTLYDTPGGGLNRRLLSNRIFGDPQALAKVNAVIHPVVRSDFTEWKSRHETFPVVAIECAILFLTGFDRLCTHTLCVAASSRLRTTRVCARDGLSPREVSLRISVQEAEEKLRQCTTFVLYNEPPLLLLPQLSLILSSITENSTFATCFTKQ